MSSNAPARRLRFWSRSNLVHGALLRELTKGAVGFRCGSLRGGITQSPGGESVLDVLQTAMRGLTDLIARAPEAQRSAHGSDA